MYCEYCLLIFFSSSVFIILSRFAGKFGIYILSAVPWRLIGILLISTGGVSGR